MNTTDNKNQQLNEAAEKPAHKKPRVNDAI